MRRIEIAVLLLCWFALLPVARQLPGEYWRLGLSAYSLQFGLSLLLLGMLALFQWRYGQKERVALSYFADGDKPWSIRFISLMIVFYSFVIGAFWSGIIEPTPQSTVPPYDLVGSYHRDAASLFATKAILHYAPQVLLAPLCEEFLFRGLLLTYFKKRCNRWLAWGLCTGLFVLQHNIYQDVAHFFRQGGALLLIGIIFMAVAERARSLVPVILLHAMHNLVHMILEMRQFMQL